MRPCILGLLFAFLASADWESDYQQDPITDDIMRTIATNSESGHELWPDVLFVRAEEYGNGSASLFLGLITSSDVTHDIECITRVDSDQPYIYDLAYWPDRGILMFPGYATQSLIEELLAGNQFVIRFDTDDSKTISLIFSLQGMTRAALDAGIL